MSIAGKVVVVTGGTSGIGRACSLHFASAGARVVIGSNQREEGDALQREIAARGGDARYIYVDVADEASVRDFVAAAVAHYGRIDAVHANAGVWRGGKVVDVTDEDWNAVMGVNVRGVFNILKYTVPEMEKAGRGVVLITTSVAAYIGFPAHALYCASKAAIDALVRCMATDYAGVIRTVGISPGTIDTPMLAQTAVGWKHSLEELYQDIERKIPVRRLGRPEDVARVAAFLISDEASYINGTTIVLDGGTMALPPW